MKISLEEQIALSQSTNWKIGFWNSCKQRDKKIQFENMFGMKMQQSTHLGYNWFFYFSKTSLFTQVWENVQLEKK